MFDFIAENFLIFIFVGVTIILIAIGYIVDKFIINKDKNIEAKNEKKEEIVNQNYDNKKETSVFPEELNSTTNEEMIEEQLDVHEENNSFAEPINISQAENLDEVVAVPEMVAPTENNRKFEDSDEENVVVTQPLFENENQVDTNANSDETVWKV